MVSFCRFVLIAAFFAAASSVAGAVSPDGTIDADLDGWTPTDGDCCDTIAQCPRPALVNPGAIELASTPYDDDCDGSTVVPSTGCASSQQLSAVTAVDAARGIEICASTTLNPPLPQRRWGLISAQYRLADGSTPTAGQLTTRQNQQTALLASFGTDNTPRRNATLTVISTGTARTPDLPGYIAVEPGSSQGGSVVPQDTVPPGACPSNNNAFDSNMVVLSIRTPTNAAGFAVDWRFFSAEYPFECSSSNDQALILLTTAAALRENVAIDAQGRTASVNAGPWSSCVPSGSFSCPGGTTGIAGTGYDVASAGISAGAATTWNAARGAFVPGETIDIAFSIFDLLDGSLDSTLIVDDFRWLTIDLFADGLE